MIPISSIEEILAQCINLIDAGDREGVSALVDQYPQYARELNSYLSQASSVNRRLEDTSVPGKVTVAVSNTTESFPREFGKYRLLQRLGAGAMGVVYQAHDSELGRVVALKLLRANRNTPNNLERFQIEAQTAAKLIHPNIVRIYEVGEIDSQAYFTMDCVDGFDLKHIADGVGVGAEEAAQYVSKIARATHFAHEQGVLHRDIKPSNILLEKATHQPLVSDFGLAKNLVDPSELTMTNEVIGSPAYLAPELIGEVRVEASKATDIYSIGATLYHLLSGMPPFRGDSVATVLQNVMLGDVLSLRSLERSIPRDLATICEKCIERDPQRRYATALEVAEDLERFLRKEPIRARPITPVLRGWRWCQRRPAQAALIVLGCLLMVGATLTAIKINGLRQIAEARRLEAEQKANESDDLAELLIGIFGSPDPTISGRDITVAEQLDLAMKDPRFAMKDQPLRRAAFLLAIGKTYRGLDVPDKALEAFREAEAIYANRADYEKERLTCQLFIALSRTDSQVQVSGIESVKKQWEQDYPTDSKEYLEILDGLAAGYLRGEQFEKALNASKTALKVAVSIYGEDDLETTRIRQQYCRILIELSRGNDAIPIIKKDLNRIKNLGLANSVDDMHLLGTLAMAYRMTGKHEQAVKSQERAFKIAKINYAKDHPVVLQRMQSLAVLLMSVKRHNEGAELLRQRFDICQNKYGAGHPMTLGAQSQYVEWLLTQGRRVEAEELLRRVIPQMQEAKASTKLTLAAQNRLAGLLGRRADTEQDMDLREELRRESLEVYRAASPVAIEVFGERGRNRVIVDGAHAMTLEKLGLHRDAAVLREQLIPGTREFGTTHGKYVMGWFAAIKNYYLAGDSTKYHNLSKSFVEEFEPLLNDRRWVLATVYSFLAESQLEAGENDNCSASIARFLELYPDWQAQVGPETHSFVLAMKAQFLKKQNPEKAAQLMNEAKWTIESRPLANSVFAIRREKLTQWWTDWNNVTE